MQANDTNAFICNSKELPNYTVNDLRCFEDDIASEFNNSNIRAPIHLYDGNEEQIINIFKNINKEDWVLCSWRSHYQCLLKGVPKDLLKAEIMKGNSITLNFPDYKILSSAIVTGILPISIGIAMGLKRSNSSDKVWCFMGEMTSETGSAHECIKYAINHKLPIHFVIEDNGKSVCTDTRKTWGMNKLTFENVSNEYLTYYKYESKYPHAGAGKRVQF